VAQLYVAQSKHSYSKRIEHGAWGIYLWTRPNFDSTLYVFKEANEILEKTSVLFVKCDIRPLPPNKAMS
ncbi:MAG: hypothetical protein Q7S57_04350, partial [bacterium]|nr:hypothetical protein [bacterium]